MAICLCKQPCERHKFPMMSKEDWEKREFPPLSEWREFSEKLLDFMRQDK